MNANTNQKGHDAPYQILPELSAEEYEALKADIREHGVLVAIEVDESGALLDGHHRLRAVKELRAEGVQVADPPEIRRAGLSEEAKREHVLALNLARRHLAREQKQKVAADLAAAGWSNRRVAGALGVDEGTVRNWKSGAENSAPDRVTGSDGKTYRARRKPLPPPPPAPKPKAAADEPGPPSGADPVSGTITQAGPTPIGALCCEFDRVGRLIPAHLILLWGRRREIQQLLTSIGEIRGRLRRAEEEKDPLFVQVNPSEILADLSRARSAIKSAMPYAVCPNCQGHGQGCRTCKDVGLISQYHYKFVPSELKVQIEAQVAAADAQPPDAEDDEELA